MIACVYLFGPLHGHAEYLSGSAPRQTVEINVPNTTMPSFQEYRFGEPFGPPKPSMIGMNGIRHRYRLHDILENGIEECALYLHDENCCELGYEHSEDYKSKAPRTDSTYKDPMDRSPKKNREGLHLGDPLRPGPNSGFKDAGRISGDGPKRMQEVWDEVSKTIFPESYGGRQTVSGGSILGWDEPASLTPEDVTNMERYIRARQAGKSKEYVDAMQAMDELIKKEKQEGTEQ